MPLGEGIGIELTKGLSVKPLLPMTINAKNLRPRHVIHRLTQKMHQLSIYAMMGNALLGSLAARPRTVMTALAGTQHLS